MSKRKASESNESEAELDDDHEEFATNTNGPPPMKRRRRLPVEAYKYVTMQLNGHAYFSCTRCGSRYKFRKSLNKHWRDKHSDSPQQQSAEAGISLLLAAASASTSLAVASHAALEDSTSASASVSPHEELTNSSTLSKSGLNPPLLRSTAAPVTDYHTDDQISLKLEPNNNHLPQSLAAQTAELAHLQSPNLASYMQMGAQNASSQLSMLSAANLVRARFPMQSYYPMAPSAMPFGSVFVNPVNAAAPAASLFASPLASMTQEQVAQFSALWYQQQCLQWLQQKAAAQTMQLNNNNNNNNNVDEKPFNSKPEPEKLVKSEELKSPSSGRVLDLSSKEPRSNVRTAIRNPIVGDLMWNPKQRRLSLPPDVLEMRRDAEMSADLANDSVCLDLSKPSAHVTPSKRRVTTASGTAERDRPVSSAARPLWLAPADDAVTEASESACFLCGHVSCNREEMAGHILSNHSQLVNKDAFAADGDRTDGAALLLDVKQLEECEEGSVKQKLKERLHERVSNLKRSRVSLGACSPRAADLSASYPFMCPVCHWKARWISELKSHLTNHTSYKPFCCRFCDYRSKWKWDVVKHMKRCTAAEHKAPLDQAISCQNLEQASNKELSQLVLFRQPDNNADEVSSLLVRLQESPKEQNCKSSKRRSSSKSKKDLPPSDSTESSQQLVGNGSGSNAEQTNVLCNNLQTPSRSTTTASSAMNNAAAVTPTLRNIPYGALPCTKPVTPQLAGTPQRASFLASGSLALPSPFLARFQPTASVMALQQSLPDFYASLYHAHCAQLSTAMQSSNSNSVSSVSACSMLPVAVQAADVNSNVLPPHDPEVSKDPHPPTHHVQRENSTFACDECGYRARNGGDLKRHKLRHSSFKPFACATCSYQSKWKCDLKKHLAKYGHVSAINMAIDRRRHRGKSFDEVLKMHRQLANATDRPDCGSARSLQLKNVRRMLKGYKSVRASRLKQALLSTAKVLIRSALRRRYRRFMKAKTPSQLNHSAAVHIVEPTSC